MTDVPLPEMPPGPSPEDLVLIGLRKRYLELGAKIVDYENERDNIKARVRRLGAGTHPIGDGRATVTPQNRFDSDLAEKVLTGIDPKLVASCSRSTVVSGLVKQQCGDLVYEQCQKPAGEDRVSIS